MKKIVVIGDWVCGDYLPVLRARLKDLAEVWSPDRPVCSTAAMLEGLSEWVLKRQPDLVFFAVGILDTRRVCYGEGERVTSLAGFERNVSLALRLVLQRSTARPLWGTIAPVDRRRVDEGLREDAEFGYDNEVISLYNEEAKSAAQRLGVETVDIYGLVKGAARADSVRPDGLRFDSRASDFLAEKLAARLSDFCRD